MKICSEKRLVILLLGICLCFISCSSVPKFKGKSELCGLVVDDKNKPVQEFVIECKRKDGNGRFTTITDNQGIFIINDVPAGEYVFSGKKNGYAKLDNESFLFNARNKMFCCKINSVDGALSAVEKQIKSENYDAGYKLLDELCFEKGSSVEAAVYVYKTVLDIKSRKKWVSSSELRRIRKKYFPKLTDEINLLEEMMNDEE